MISRTVLLAICLLSTGCTIPLFKHPLESPDGATVPTQLFGVYKQVGGPDKLAHHVHVGPAGADAPAGVFRFVCISQPRDTVTPLKATQGYGIATRMGDVLVLQIPVYSSTDQSNGAQLDCEKWDESAILGYIFMRVRIEANRIEMSQVDDHFVASVSQTPGENSKPLILAHYMPWYAAKPFSDQWGWHWTMNHFDPEKETEGKRQIASKYHPLIDPYDSGDPHVLEYHLLLMKLAGIDGVIVDWYGLTDYRDYAILNRNTTRMLEQCERLKMKFVICYEDQTIPALVEANRVAASERVSHAVSEIDWLGKYWFKSGSYVKLDNKPLLLSFGHSGLTPVEWTQCLSRLKSPVTYFSQDIRREGAIGAFGCANG